MSDDLEDRVKKFNSMALPGQPMMMHMGTNYLVNDLWREVTRLREADAQSERAMSEALNTGDGTYRP